MSYVSDEPDTINIATGSTDTANDITSKPPNTTATVDINNNNSRLCTANETGRGLDAATEYGGEHHTRKRTNSVASSTDSVCCRICHEDDTDEMLLSMCHCSGTVGLMHKSCMERWLAAVGSDHCEICGFSFKTRRSKRPFSEWLVGESSKDDRQNLLGDCACFLVLTPLACISTWLCISGAKYYYNKGTYIANWETWGLITLTVLLVLIYITWCLVSIKYHVQTYYVWQEKNQTVQVLSESLRSKVISETRHWNQDDCIDAGSSDQILPDAESSDHSEEVSVVYMASHQAILHKDHQSLV